jgi:hypothetical protein
VSEQTLTSLAILTVNWDRGHDLIDSFVPLVAECVRKGDDEPIGLIPLQKAVEEDAGIKIPAGALQAILQRCAREGLVTKENKVYEPVRKKLEETDYLSIQQEAIRSYTTLLGKLCEFAESRHSMKWSQPEADERLLAFLRDGSVPVLAAATEGDPLPRGREQSRKAKHVLSAFAGHLADHDTEGFAALEVVAKGYVLSGVLYYPDLGKVDSRLDDLQVYCDTPFLLKALGFADRGLQAQALDLVELLRELGAKLRCFHHTREELAGVLESEARNIRAGLEGEQAYGYTMNRRFRREEIEELIITIDRTLAKLGIEVTDIPDWMANPDESALEEALIDGVRYSRAQQTEKDARSLAAIARLRKMRRVDSFENAKAIFVTTNLDLARASSKFFADVEGIGSIPVCLSVATLTHLAWVKRPLSAPDLPKHMLIASSYAALNPSRALWRRYLEALARRRETGDLSDEEYQFLRSSQEARQALMDKTLGVEDDFSPGTVDEVIARARQAIQAEAQAEANKARRALAQQGKQLARINQVHHRRIDHQAERLGKAVGYTVAALVGLAVMVGLFATLPDAPILSVDDGDVRLGTWICIGIFASITIYSAWIRHVSVAEMRRRLSSWVERRWAERGHARVEALHRIPASEVDAPGSPAA